MIVSDQVRGKPLYDKCCHCAGRAQVTGDPPFFICTHELFIAFNNDQHKVCVQIHEMRNYVCLPLLFTIYLLITFRMWRSCPHELVNRPHFIKLCY